ncbi:hypothetical protein TWF281_006291 [Arthrobotrys megalospora]
MASIASLPTELLTQILNDEVLTSADLACCAQTCSWLRDFIYSEQCNVEYTFQVDHISQSPWKLIRCLLINPKVGERFRKILITWHRRRIQRSKTWTLRWYWTYDELIDIYDTCEKWGLTASIYPVIRDGLNSEALLPLLLCYTTKLESLDLGDVSPDMTADGCHRAHGIKKMYNHCVGFEDEWDPKHWCEIGGAVCHYRGHLEKPNTPWIYSTFNPDSWLPGLSNIKEFSPANSMITEWQLPNTWPVENLSRIILLPRLETLRLYGALGERVPDPPFGKSNHNSPIKRLELIDCRFKEESYKAVAAFTGSLESFKCVLTNQNSGWNRIYARNDATNEAGAEERIAHIFLQSNMKTLTRHRISVTRKNDDFYDYFEDNSEADSEDDSEDDRGPHTGGLTIYPGSPNDVYPWSKGDEEYGLDLEDDVKMKTRNVKGRKTRSHFVK